MQVRYEDIEVLLRLMHGQMQEILSMGQTMQRLQSENNQLREALRSAEARAAFMEAIPAGENGA